MLQANSSAKNNRRVLCLDRLRKATFAVALHPQCVKHILHQTYAGKLPVRHLADHLMGPIFKTLQMKDQGMSIPSEINSTDAALRKLCDRAGEHCPAEPTFEVILGHLDLGCNLKGYLWPNLRRLQDR